MIKWWKDNNWNYLVQEEYFMQYYNTLKSLNNLSFESISNWISWVWNFIKNPVDNIVNTYNSVKETLNAIYDKLFSLTWYEKSKWWGYVATTISLSYADPGTKLLNLLWAWLFVKVVKKIDDFIIWKLKYSDKILLEMVQRNWTNTDIENVIKDPYKIWKTVDNYWWKIWDLGEPATVFFLSENQYITVNNIISSIVQVSNKNDPNWKIDPRFYDIK